MIRVVEKRHKSKKLAKIRIVKGRNKRMLNTYMLEKLAAQVQQERIKEAREHNRWVSARIALRKLSKNAAAR